MNKSKNLIIGIVLAIVIAFSGVFVSWFFFFREDPPRELPKYPDLTISNYSLENDNLTVSIKNIGDSNTTTVIIIVQIDALALILYNNSQNPVDLNISEVFIFSLNLNNFDSYFNSGTSYSITIQVDPHDDIKEKLENNNELIVDYYYYEEEEEEEEVPIPLNLLPPNTYSLNSSINSFGYAVQFNASQIIIEDSLIITNGTFNGYNVINSTILKNTTISNQIKWISIALYGDQNLTIRNIWDLRLNVVICDNSTLSLFNCSIQELIVAGSNNVFLSNSSIKVLSTATNITNLVSLRITNHSFMEYCFIYSPTYLEIEYSSINMLFIMISSNPYSQEADYLASGIIKNCSINNFIAYGQTDLNIYGTEFYQVSILGKTRINLVECIITEEYVYQNSICILNNTKILSELQYGIIVSSGSVNITNGIIQGTNYVNNTILINANVSSMILKDVVVNNTGQLYISNSSLNLYLYDLANVIINDSSTNTTNSYVGYLEGSSRLIGINSSFNFLLCQENSSVDLSENCTVQSILVNSTNDVSIDKCILDEIGWHSEPQGGHKAEIINSTIETFHAPPSSKVDIINSSIEILYEGIRFQTGTNYFNSSGIFGAGIDSNYLNISGSLISNRSYKYIEIMGATKVILEDLHNIFSIAIESGNLTVNNCTIGSLQMRNNAIVYLENCSSPDIESFSLMLLSMLSPQGITCYDNSQLYINNSIISDGNIIMLFNAAQITITNSEIFCILLFQESRAVISYSEVWMIRVTASSLAGYSLNISHSSIEYLTTISWNCHSISINFLFMVI
jgi:hypothetical protein